MDGDDAELVPAVLILAMTGATGTVLSMQAAILDSPFAVPLIVVTAGLLVAAKGAEHGRPWSLRLAAAVAPVGAVIWLTVLVIADAPGDLATTAVCIGMAAGSVWARSHLRRIAAGPDWLRSDLPKAVPAGESQPAGWIEELPDERQRVRGNPRSTDEVPGSGHRAVTTFARV